MIDSLLKKYSAQSTEAVPRASQTNETETDDLGAFGWLRGVDDRAIMLELRRKNGNITAIGYAWLEKVEFDPSEGITLHTGGQQIHIRGRNLNADLGGRAKLFEGITRHRVPWVQEADQPALLTAKQGETVVEEID